MPAHEHSGGTDRPDAGESLLAITGLTKTFTTKAGPVTALRHIDLTIGRGEFVAIVGASGCGKSTLLRIIAGLEGNFQGEVLLEGRRISRPGRDRGVVFQEHRLLPWLTVEENVAFGLDGKRGAAKTGLVREYLELVGLAAFARAYPHQLSGGMAQRAAIARALVNRPRILLLDEPFGALDALTRIQMQQEILRIREAGRTTMILVTHDIDEAIFLGDRVVVMSSRPGTIKRIALVDLPRPRDRASYDFVRIRKQVYAEFFAQSEAPFSYVI